MGATVMGGAELLAKIARYKAQAQPAADAALYQRATQVMAASDSLVPVQYGVLRASHYVELPADGKIKMGYGASYALPVHENLDAHHAHGQAKFLEHARDEAAPDNARWIKAKTIENLRNGVSLRPGSMPTSHEDGAMAGAHHEALRENRARTVAAKKANRAANKARLASVRAANREASREANREAAKARMALMRDEHGKLKGGK